VLFHVGVACRQQWEQPVLRSPVRRQQPSQQLHEERLLFRQIEKKRGGNPINESERTKQDESHRRTWQTLALFLKSPMIIASAVMLSALDP